MKAIILAATGSERLKPYTQTRAKPMILVAGNYILETMISFLREAGIQEIFIVVNHKQEMIREHFAYGDDKGVKIEYVVQKEVTGIGNALLNCRDIIGCDESFLLIYGDILTDGNIFHTALHNFYERGEDIAVVSLPKSSGEYGNVYLDHEMKIRRLVEKPQDELHANYVFSGVFVLNSSIFSCIESNNGDMEQTFQNKIQESGLQAALWEKGWIDIIYPWHILEANKMMMDRVDFTKIDNSVVFKGSIQMEGPVIIEAGVTVESGSILKGPCYIGKNTYIGNNVLVRSYTVLGPESTVGYGSELKNCVIFGKANIGRLSFIGDSVVGENARLGSGTTTVNHYPDHSTVKCNTTKEEVDSKLSKLGALIGDNVTIGARRTLGPGLIVDAGSIIRDNINLSSVY